MLIDNSYSPEKRINELSPLPLYVIHGNDDTVVPFHHGKRIFNLAQEPKKLLALPEGRHINSMSVSKGKYRKVVLEYFKRLEK